MANETKPTPDPTELTTQSLHREIGLMEGEITRRFNSAVTLATEQHDAIRDYINGQIETVNQRFDGIDRATSLLDETINRVPTDVTKEVSHLRELTDERFDSIAIQFKERDTRQEREAKDNKVAVDAAFAAQKEAAAEQNKSNTLAISKSETATSETINKLAELFKTTTDGLADKIDDLKDRIQAGEKRNGTYEASTTGISVGTNQTWGYALGAAGVLVAIITVILKVSGH